MKITEAMAVKEYSLLVDIYAEYGIEGHTISIPRPFTGDHFRDLRDELGIDPDGLANQANQVFAENVRNNLSSRVKSAHKKNEALTEAQAKGERTDEEYEELPTQDDVDELVSAYDFSGVRISSGETTAATPFDKELARLVKLLVKNILKTSGFQDQPAPVTVAKKGDTPSTTQVSFEDFLSLVQGIVQGEGIWGEETAEDGSPSPYYTKRQDLIKQAETNVAAVQMEAEAASSNLKAA